MQIESIHEVINKARDVIDLPHETVKVELNEPNLKCDQTFDDNWTFHSEPDELSSQSSIGKCR